jgi:ABC-type transporter Mla subunit MlaD
VALLVAAVLAFVPDPFFRYHTVATTLDNVEGIDPGTPVMFRGAAVGEVRSVDLDPDSRNFKVRISVIRKWRPSACSFVSIGAANPLTAPRIDLVSIEQTAAASPSQCHAAMLAQACEAVPQRGQSGLALPGCKRAPDLIATTALAMSEAANVARSANQMAQRLQTMIQGSGNGSGAGLNMAEVANNATQTLAALKGLSTRLDSSFAPGKGDLALTLGNVRQMTGKMAKIDMGSVNGMLRGANGMVGDNRANVSRLVDQAAESATQARATLEGASASLVQASANLNQMSANLNALSERLAADPTYAIRGQHYADPPGLEMHK